MDEQQNNSDRILELSEHLGNLYLQREHIEAEIRHTRSMVHALVAEISQTRPEEATKEKIETPPGEPLEVLRFDPVGFKKPTWDIYDLLPPGRTIHRDEVLKLSEKAYGDRYSLNAVKSSLYRLRYAGLVERYGDEFLRPE